MALDTDGLPGLDGAMAGIDTDKENDGLRPWSTLVALPPILTDLPRVPLTVPPRPSLTTPPLVLARTEYDPLNLPVRVRVMVLLMENADSNK